MTIYSQHANRGKVQILATYHRPAGVMSSTVTSVDEAALAGPIVDTLNRISACATVPVSVWDERGRRFKRYPTDHLAALTDRDARQRLVEGTHSLWYEQAMLLLHRALADLDIAVAAVPAPVRTAISAELEAEARGLRDELADHTDRPEPAERRVWDFESPFVVLGESVSGLRQQDRDKLNDLEQWLPQAGSNRLSRTSACLSTCTCGVPTTERSCSSTVSRSVTIRTTRTGAGTSSTSRRPCLTASGGGPTGTSRYAGGLQTVRKPTTRASRYSTVFGPSRRPSRRLSNY